MEIVILRETSPDLVKNNYNVIDNYLDENAHKILPIIRCYGFMHENAIPKKWKIY